MDKKQMRKVALEKRHLICNKKEKSSLIKESLLPLLNQQHSIGIYVALEDEVATLEIIEELLKDNQVSVPTCLANGEMEFHLLASLNDLKVGKFGIKESGNAQVVVPDCLIVPLVAFNEQGHRLGMGKGYYDRYLSKHSSLKTIGLAFEEQKMEDIIVEEHDQVLDVVVSEIKLYFSNEDDCC